MKARSLVRIAAVGATFVGLVVSCQGFREDEIECEQAYVRLRECCPGFHRSVDCSFTETRANDCNNTIIEQHYPEISLAKSRCIQDKSCAALAPLCETLSSACE